MAIAKVVLNGETLMDTTQKTVTANTMLDGTTALKNDGTGITGNITSKSSSDLTASGATVTAPAGYYPSAASKSVASGSATTPATSITANPTISVNASGLITASVSGSQSVTPSVSAGYVSAGTAGTVSVSGSKTQQLTTQAAKTVVPTESEQTAVASGVYTTGAVKVGAISSTYVGSDIAQNDSDDLTASGATVTVPAGYYAETASKSVATTTHPNPTASVNSTTGLVTASHTQGTGYVTGGTTTGTMQLSTQAAATITPSTSQQTAVAAGKYTTGAVTVDPIPSEYIIPTGTIQIDQNGTIDVTQYASAEVNVSGGVTPVTVEESDVNFIDYDGTILYSYTASDFANLSALPANPSHAGLTAQGWNWSLSDAKTYVAQYGKLWIGQMYITSDGKTRIYITLDNSNYLSPYLAIAVNGTVEVDWGDGTAADTVTGTNNTTFKYTLHEYAAIGNYVITIAVSNGSFAFYGTNYYPSILRTVGAAGNRARSRVYSTAITKIEIGSSVSIGTYGFYNIVECKTITIPSGVTSIGNSAFYNCYALQSVTIPSGVTSIGTSVFYNCYTLQSVTIPSGVTSIAINIFSNCYALHSATIPSGVTSIGASAFYNCYVLQSVTIPSGVTSIGGSAFSGCFALQFVTIPSGVTSIGTSVFYNCYTLQSVTIPSDVMSIETSMFVYCYALQSVTIPSGVTSIEATAFSSCYTLQSLIVPSGVTSIGSSAFANCYAMLEYHFLPTTPPTLASTNAFNGIQSGTKIYVPYSADHSVLEAYQTATNWSTYASYMEEEPQ